MVFSTHAAMMGVVGGLMIGVAAAIMLLGAGRIAGVSGMTARAVGLSTSGAPRLVAATFVLGLPLGAIVVATIGGPVSIRFPDSTAVLLLGGLLVGYGTRLGSGCTSGHGVCGLSRLSPRSLAAVAIFMGTGATTVAAMNMLGISW